MTDESSMLYAKLLGETAAIRWQELEPFFARGALLRVASALDLVAVALAVAQDDRPNVAGWLSGGTVARLTEEQARDWLTRDPALWAVVVAPWVLVQERDTPPATH